MVYNKRFTFFAIPPVIAIIRLDWRCRNNYLLSSIFFQIILWKWLLLVYSLMFVHNSYTHGNKTCVRSQILHQQKQQRYITSESEWTCFALSQLCNQANKIWFEAKFLFLFVIFIRPKEFNNLFVSLMMFIWEWIWLKGIAIKLKMWLKYQIYFSYIWYFCIYNFVHVWLLYRV